MIAALLAAALMATPAATLAVTLAATPAAPSAAPPAAAPVVPAQAAPIAAPDLKPATIAGAQAFDMASKITGRTYRISVMTPLAPAPPAGYPVDYVLDGDLTFGSAAATMALGQTGDLRPGVLVAVGYPDATLMKVMSLRNRDLTPTQPDAQGKAAMGGMALTTPENFGGAADFYRFLTEELAPVIQARFKTDPKDTALQGYSLGGLFTLGAMFAHPGDFRSYIIGSPSIWWNGKEVLQGEAAFAQAVRSGKAAPRVLVTSAGWEQDAGHAPKTTAMSPAQVKAMLESSRMVDNARELAERLKALKGGPGYDVRYAVFDGETHGSGIPAATARGVEFALEH